MQAPPIVERDVLQSIDDGSGPFKVTNPAFRFQRTVAQARNRVPDLGADGPDLLRTLGCDEAAVQAALAAGTLFVKRSS